MRKKCLLDMVEVSKNEEYDNKQIGILPSPTEGR